MKKIIIILILLLTSCAGRKVQLSHTDIKKDSIIKTDTKISIVEIKEKTDSTNIKTITEETQFIITPIDSSKNIIVDGKTYKNVILRINKNKSNSLYINNKKQSDNIHRDSITKQSIRLIQHVKNKIKSIDKKANYSWLFILIIALVGCYIVWINIK